MRRARATAGATIALCAPIFNGATKDSLRQLTFRSRSVRTTSTFIRFQLQRLFLFSLFIIVLIETSRRHNDKLVAHCYQNKQTQQQQQQRASTHSRYHYGPHVQTRTSFRHVATLPNKPDLGSPYYAYIPRDLHNSLQSKPSRQINTRQDILQQRYSADVQARSFSHVPPSQSIGIRSTRPQDHKVSSIDSSIGGTNSAIRKVLPNGPPPFRPSSLVLGLNSLGALEKLKGTKIFKRMYKSKAYYLFLDLLEQLAGLADKMARKKIDLAETRSSVIQAVVHKFVIKGGQLLKLKWPLVMLNPHFIKEILSNPTLLVMLFHAIEVAYMSMPASFWLKPLVKMIKQPSPEKEEEVWWRRKRLYEVLNGPGSSELQPNLRTKHFRHPGEPAPPISLAGLANVVRHFTDKPPPDPSYYSYPADYAAFTSPPLPPSGGGHMVELEQSSLSNIYQDVAPDLLGLQPHHYQLQQQPQEQQRPRKQPQVSNNLYEQQEHVDSGAYMSAQQEKAFLANQPVRQYSSKSRQHQHGHVDQSAYDQQSGHLQHLTTAKQHSALTAGGTSTPSILEMGTDHFENYGSFGEGPPPVAPNTDFELNNFLAPNDGMHESHVIGRHSPGELMSKTDFDLLDPREKELILAETRKSHAESRLADELIKQQSEYVNSIVHRQDGAMLKLQHSNNNNGDNNNILM